jgi:hypothetical protein
MNHKPDHHGKMNQKPDYHGKVNHKPDYHGKMNHKPDHHGKMNQKSDHHGKVNHKQDYHGKMNQKPDYYAPHQHINSCEGETSNVLCHYICQKWCKSDVDSQKFKRTSSKFKSTKLLSNK